MTVYLSLSGGLDSTTLASLPWPEPVECVAFNYGQRHVRELRSAEAVADHFNHGFRVVDLPRLWSPSLTGNTPVPHGHYAERSMELTVVQGRNLLFASTLIALTQPGDTVAIGVHAGDHAVYADCRPEFVEPLRHAVASAYAVTLSAPFLHMSKADIAATSAKYEAPVHLSWSCYEGGDLHCGRCGTCVERAEAFHLAGVTDPTIYADTEFWKAAVS